MSEEDIRHIYCDGDGCCESIDGYNPHAKNIDKFIVEDLAKQGWTIVKEEDVIDGFFCGNPVVFKPGDTKHFCPKCNPAAECREITMEQDNDTKNPR